MKNKISKVQKVVLGTVQFGVDYGINNTSGRPGGDEVFEILSHAHSNGVRYLDTAQSYGDAHSLIYQYHKNNEKFKVFTKFLGQPKITKIFYSNLCKELDCEQLEGLYYHSFNDYSNCKTTLFNELGSDLAIGVSVYSPQELKIVSNDKNINIIQIPFNLLDNYTRWSDYLKRAKDNQKIIISRSCFLQGLFFMDIERLPKKFLKYKEKLMFIKNVAQDCSLSLNSLCLNYPFSIKEIDFVVFGVDSRSHLEKNLNSLSEDIVDFPKIKFEKSDLFLVSPNLWNSN